MRYALMLHWSEAAAGELSEETIAEGQAAFDAYPNGRKARWSKPIGRARRSHN